MVSRGFLRRFRLGSLALLFPGGKGGVFIAFRFCFLRLCFVFGAFCVIGRFAWSVALFPILPILTRGRARRLGNLRFSGRSGGLRCCILPALNHAVENVGNKALRETGNERPKEELRVLAAVFGMKCLQKWPHF